MTEKELHIPPTTLNIARHLMPQIQSNDVQAFIDKLKSEGIKVTQSKIGVNTIKAVQGEFNKEKILAMMQKDLSKSKPVIVSQDGFIVDGNHRWLAELNKNFKSKIDAIIIHLNIMDVIQQARLFDKVFYKQVHESRIKIIHKTLSEAYKR